MIPKRRRMTLRRREAVSGYMFIAPWIVGFVAFFAVNFLQVIRFSVSHVEPQASGGSNVTFVGLSNFVQMFTRHATFNRVLTESVGSLCIDVPLITFFSLLIAIILNRKFKFRGLVRAIFFLPVIMASGAITSALDQILRSMFAGISTVSDQMQTTSGLDVSYIMSTFTRYGVPKWLIDYILNVIARMYDIIKMSGVQILIFLAALQAIPGSLYEVAHIEGATAYESFWKITFPMVSPLILTNVVYTIVDSYTNSDVVQLAYETAFTSFNFGLSAAMSLVSTFFGCLVLLVVGALISVYTFYQN